MRPNRHRVSRSLRAFAIGLVIDATLLSNALATQDVIAASPTRLQATLEALAEQARPGFLGIAVLDEATAASFRVHADHPFPMMSVFKAPLGAAVLDRIDHGSLTLDTQVTIARGDLRRGRSRIRENFSGDRMRFSVRDLLDAAVGDSDNTAADALLRLIGGPARITAYLHAHGIAGIRVDRGEGELARDISGLDNQGRAPRNETAPSRRQRERRAFAAYLVDPRDTATPDAAVDFLIALRRATLLSPASTKLLLDMMTHSATVPNRLKGGVPEGASLAHKSGTSETFEGVTAAHNDIGILSWPDGRCVVIAAFLTASPASESERDAIFSTLARAVAADRHP